MGPRALTLTRFGGHLNTWATKSTEEVHRAPQVHQPYPPEFRAEAIRLVRECGRSVNAAAKDLGVSTESLRNWVKQADLAFVRTVGSSALGGWELLSGCCQNCGW